MTPKTYTNTQASRALNRKGFREKKGRKNHRIFELVVNGKITHIRTKISHTRKGSISGKLRKLMARDLKMDGGNQFNEFLDCPYTLSQYLVDLQANGHLP
ncbi:hypothetical protein CEE45_01525 [Candidatus Heimdallarchaeota archaeon B3_Heim]|nr:MAG: hypothetical protein CEE45_01525 [Candidatus Heimdallarchaeota archaeon B3_Heim]